MAEKDKRGVTRRALDIICYSSCGLTKYDTKVSKLNRSCLIVKIIA